MGALLMRSLILSLILTLGFYASGVPKVTINGATFPTMTFQNQTPPPGFENPVLAYVSWIHIPPPPSGFTNAGSFSPDGTPEAIIIPDAAGLEATTALSVGCWVKGAAQSKGIISKYSETKLGNRRPWFIIGSNGTDTDHMEVWVCAAGGGVCATRKEYKALAASALDSTWHHVGFTWDNGTLTLYQDGAAQTATVDRDDAMTEIDATGTDDVFIGDMESTGDIHFNGFIDECFVDTNTVYSGANFASIYNSGSPDSLTSLSPTGWWRFESDSAATGAGAVLDASGNAHHGTGSNLEAGDVNDADVP